MIPIILYLDERSSISPKELAALYRAKEKHDEERARIQGIVRRLRSVGVNADVVERVHYITLAN